MIRLPYSLIFGSSPGLRGGIGIFITAQIRGKNQVIPRLHRYDMDADMPLVEGKIPIIQILL